MVNLAICDANVLIDFLSIPEKEVIFGAMESYFKSVFVPDVILNEVDSIDIAEATSLGLTVIETPLSLLTATPPPGLSMQDNACLELAVKNSWICITNDKKLRKTCIGRGCETIYGLGLLLDLVKGKLLSKSSAESAAKAIRKTNSNITETLMKAFLEMLET